MPNHNAQAIAVKEPKINVLANIQANGRENGNIYNSDGLSPTLLARDYKDPKKIVEPSLVIPEDTTLGYALAHEGDGVYTNRPEQKRGVVQKQMIQTIKANSNDLGVVVNKPNLRIRKLVPLETWRLMGFSDEAFNLASKNQSNSSLYHQAGDSIVVNVLMELFRSLL